MEIEFVCSTVKRRTLLRLKDGSGLYYIPLTKRDLKVLNLPVGAGATLRLTVPKDTLEKKPHLPRLRAASSPS